LVLLFKAFDSFSLAVLTLLNVPFALLGGGIGLYLAGMPMSGAAAGGVIALVGPGALNGGVVRSAIAARPERGGGVGGGVGGSGWGPRSWGDAGSGCGRC